MEEEALVSAQFKDEIYTESYYWTYSLRKKIFIQIQSLISRTAEDRDRLKLRTMAGLWNNQPCKMCLNARSSSDCRCGYLIRAGSLGIESHPRGE